jgi:hypothetical protein
MAHLAPGAAQHFGWRDETPPHTGMDPETAGWVRSKDDPNVRARLKHLQDNAGIKGLEVIDGNKVAAGDEDEVARAVRLFHRDGFVAMRDALSPMQLAKMRVGVERNVADMLSRDPHGEGRGTPPNNQPGRYSFGSTRHLHEDEWCMLVDLPTTTPVLSAIFQSSDCEQLFCPLCRPQPPRKPKSAPHFLMRARCSHLGTAQTPAGELAGISASQAVSNTSRCTAT